MYPSPFVLEGQPPVLALPRVGCEPTVLYLDAARYARAGELARAARAGGKAEVETLLAEVLPPEVIIVQLVVPLSDEV